MGCLLPGVGRLLPSVSGRSAMWAVRTSCAVRSCACAPGPWWPSGLAPLYARSGHSCIEWRLVGPAGLRGHRTSGAGRLALSAGRWSGEAMVSGDRTEKPNAAVLPCTGCAGPQRGTKTVGVCCPAGTRLSPPYPGPGQLLEPFRGGKLCFG